MWERGDYRGPRSRDVRSLLQERQGQGQADRSAREGRRAGRGPYCRGATGHHNEYFGFKDEEGKLLYIQQHKGAYYRVVGEDEDGDPLLVKGLGDLEKTLFELPGLPGRRGGEPVAHVEGCKDVLTAKERLGVAATTSGGTKLGRVSSPRTTGELRKYGSSRTMTMRVPTTPPRWPRISSGLRRQSNHRAPGLPEKGDLTDWLDDEHTVEEFFEIVKTTPAMDSGRAWPEKPSPWT